MRRPCSPAPRAPRYLADFGADVIKVERPDGGDTLEGSAGAILATASRCSGS